MAEFLVHLFEREQTREAQRLKRIIEREGVRVCFISPIENRVEQSIQRTLRAVRYTETMHWILLVPPGLYEHAIRCVPLPRSNLRSMSVIVATIRPPETIRSHVRKIVRGVRGSRHGPYAFDGTHVNMIVYKCVRGAAP